MKILSSILLLFLLVSMSFSPVRESAEPEIMAGMTERHNYWRSQVGVPPLEWSDELAAFAQKWADELARRGCEMQHRPFTGEWGTYLGENIYWSTGIKNKAVGVADSWASEIKFYDAASGNCEKGKICGHYTQMVWSATTKVGCAMARCGEQEVWVCNYDPAGNMVGRKPY